MEPLRIKIFAGIYLASYSFGLGGCSFYITRGIMRDKSQIIKASLKTAQN